MSSPDLRLENPSFALLAQLPEDALVVVFQFLPASSHSVFSCVCRQWYHWSCYSDVFADLLSHRIRYWIDWMRDQGSSNQTLEALLRAHPVLTSEEANRQLELVSLSHESHPTSVSAAARLTASLAASSNSESVGSSSVTLPKSKRVTIQTSQMLNLVEIVCSGFRSGVRRTQESHTHSLTGALLRPLQTFPLQRLDLSNYAFVDAPLIRALLHLPTLSSISLSNCKMLSDACVGLILSNHSLRTRLTFLDVSGNRQLTGKGWFSGPAFATQPGDQDLADDLAATSLAEDESTVVTDESSPTLLSHLTSLNLSQCGGISPQNLGANFFSPNFLAPIRSLCTEGCSGKLVVAFFKAAHHLRNLREWSSSRCSSVTISAVESSLLTRGYFKNKSQSSFTLLTNEELQVEESLLLSSENIASEDANDTPPLRHLTSLDLSSNSFLTTDVLAYLLSLTHAAPTMFASSSIPLHSTPSLTSISLRDCNNLSPLVLEILAFHCGANLRHLRLDNVTLDDESFGPFLQLKELSAAIPSSRAELTPSPPLSSPPSQLSFPRLETLHLDSTDPPMPLLGRFLSEVIAPCNTLRTLSLASLHPPLEQSLTATLQETAAADAERRRMDRTAIEEAARQRGLDLPAASSSSLSAQLEQIQGRFLVEEQERRCMSGAFIRAIAALSCSSLKILNLANNPDINDALLLEWMALGIDTNQGRLSMAELNLSGCANISNEGLIPLMEVLCGTTNGNAGKVDLLVAVDDCANVQTHALNTDWSWRVQGNDSFQL